MTDHDPLCPWNDDQWRALMGAFAVGESPCYLCQIIARVREDERLEQISGGEAWQIGFQDGRESAISEATARVMSEPSWSVPCPEFMPDLAEYDAVMVVRRDHVRQVMASMQSTAKEASA